MEEEQHQLLEYTMEERKAYLCLVASIASADNKVTDDEIKNVRELCKKVALDGQSTGIVLAAAEDPRTAPLKQCISLLAKSELRFTLLTDMLFLAYADNNYAPEERSVIADFALELKVNSEQLSAIEDYVKAIDDYKNMGLSTKELKKIGGEVSAGLAAAGVPIAAVAISGSVWGLSTAGIVSGLAALGLGFGLVPGIGMVAVIGVASYFGVRWLYKNLVASDVNT